jgi:hypothetical protein
VKKRSPIKKALRAEAKRRLREYRAALAKLRALPDTPARRSES